MLIPAMALAAAIILLCFAALVVVANICGWVSASRRARRGDPRGYSCVSLVSLACAAGAWLLAPGTIGPWALIPALLDPGTWSLAYLPVFYFLRRARINDE
jgi:hypothetical protein